MQSLSFECAGKEKFPFQRTQLPTSGPKIAMGRTTHWLSDAEGKMSLKKIWNWYLDNGFEVLSMMILAALVVHAFCYTQPPTYINSILVVFTGIWLLLGVPAWAFLAIIKYDEMLSLIQEEKAKTWTMMHSIEGHYLNFWLNKITGESITFTPGDFVSPELKMQVMKKLLPVITQEQLIQVYESYPGFADTVNSRKVMVMRLKGETLTINLTAKLLWEEFFPGEPFPNQQQ